MSFRRFTRRGTSSRFRSMRRFRGLRKIVQTARWEVGRIFVDADRELPNSSAAEVLEYFHIASIPSSLGALSATVTEQRVGTVLAGMQRKLEIGGVVLDYDCFHSGELQGDRDLGEGQYDVNYLLLVDRIVDDGGGTPFPASVATFSPFQASFPSSILTTTTPTSLTEPVMAPTRILWERTVFNDINPKRLRDDEEGVLYVPQNQRLAVRGGTLNRKLKLQLDETQGLYFAINTRNGPLFNHPGGARNIQKRVTGKIYYRFRQ